MNLTVKCSEWFFIMFQILYTILTLQKVTNIYLDFQFHWVPCILLEWREEGWTDKLSNTWKFPEDSFITTSPVLGQLYLT